MTLYLRGVFEKTPLNNPSKTFIVHARVLVRVVFLFCQLVYDPVMSFNTESDSEGGCVEICRNFYEIVKNVKGVDFKTLQDFINL